MSAAKKLTVKEWKPLDERVKGMQGAYLETAKKMAEEIYATRQQEVADRYGMSQPAVAKLVKIGEQVDSRFIRIANKLPSSQETVYELSTLSDEDFKSFKVTPKTTRLEVQDYKRGIKGKAGVKSNAGAKGKAGAKTPDFQTSILCQIKAEMDKKESEWDGLQELLDVANALKKHPQSETA